MDPARWDELETIFGQALALPPKQRLAFLDQACLGNADLRDELDSLLAHYEQAPAYFDDLGDAVPMPAFRFQERDLDVLEPALQFEFVVGKTHRGVSFARR